MRYEAGHVFLVKVGPYIHKVSIHQVTYWGIGLLFEKIGDVNQLPPAIAAWSPDALFSLTGLYLLLRMRS